MIWQFVILNQPREGQDLSDALLWLRMTTFSS